jgi:hypothetical protein
VKRARTLVAVGIVCAMVYGCGDDASTPRSNTAGTSNGGDGGGGAGGKGSGGTTASMAGTAGKAGAGGSSVAVGGADAGGGASEAGADGGGAPGAGAGGAGGAGPNVEEICAEYAAFYKAKALATDCPDGSSTVKAACIQGYATDTCIDEAADYFACASPRPDSDFECVDNQVVPKTGVCTTEAATYLGCAQ